MSGLSRRTPLQVNTATWVLTSIRPPRARQRRVVRRRLRHVQIQKRPQTQITCQAFQGLPAEPRPPTPASVSLTPPPSATCTQRRMDRAAASSAQRCAARRERPGEYVLGAAVDLLPDSIGPGVLLGVAEMEPRQAIRFRYRQRPQDDADHREDRRARADADRQRQHRHARSDLLRQELPLDADALDSGRGRDVYGSRISRWGPSARIRWRRSSLWARCRRTATLEREMWSSCGTSATGRSSRSRIRTTSAYVDGRWSIASSRDAHQLPSVERPVEVRRDRGGPVGPERRVAVRSRCGVPGLVAHDRADPPAGGRPTPVLVTAAGRRDSPLCSRRLQAASPFDQRQLFWPAHCLT